ncbi:hypothetical protein RRF56_14845 [Nodosilinea sp. E11]|nr:hypothetical protein [Nodosilinea sp. E11]WOD37484.1 hypothetical protein RRF56_14845 [Nodosilinea sp. E11]
MADRPDILLLVLDTQRADRLSCYGYDQMLQDLRTLAERLEASGYYTAGFCNNPLVGVINNGLRRGFTSFLNYSGLLTSKPKKLSGSSICG